jgi:hypothetical protein
MVTKKHSVKTREPGIPSTAPSRMFTYLYTFIFPCCPLPRTPCVPGASILAPIPPCVDPPHSIPYWKTRTCIPRGPSRRNATPDMDPLLIAGHQPELWKGLAAYRLPSGLPGHAGTQSRTGGITEMVAASPSRQFYPFSPCIIDTLLFDYPRHPQVESEMMDADTSLISFYTTA